MIKNNNLVLVTNNEIVETLKNNGLDMKVLKDVVEIPIYADANLTLERFFENNIEYKYNKNVEELECLFFEMTRIYYILVRLL